MVIILVLLWQALVVTLCHGYSSLSCEFEMSKYSCSYQQLEQAQQMSVDFLVNFTQASAGESHDFPVGKRVFMIGDSYTRQLFIAAACAEESNVVDSYVDWQSHWPCNVKENCVSSGRHSGFNEGSILFKSGSELHYMAHKGAMYTLNKMRNKNSNRNGQPAYDVDIIMNLSKALDSHHNIPYSMLAKNRTFTWKSYQAKKAAAFAAGEGFFLTSRDVILYGEGVHSLQHLPVGLSLLMQRRQERKEGASRSREFNSESYITPAVVMEKSDRGEMEFTEVTSGAQYDRCYEAVMTNITRQINIASTRSPRLSRSGPRTGLAYYLRFCQHIFSLMEVKDFGMKLLSQGIGNGNGRPRFIFYHTPTQHFDTYDGRYTLDANRCKKKTSNPIHSLEMALFLVNESVDATLYFDDRRHGALHVGAGGDCTHYCMPGIPDATYITLVKLL
jgi:hypothetical protein